MPLELDDEQIRNIRQQLNILDNSIRRSDLPVEVKFYYMGVMMERLERLFKSADADK